MAHISSFLNIFLVEPFYIFYKTVFEQITTLENPLLVLWVMAGVHQVFVHPLILLSNRLASSQRKIKKAIRAEEERIKSATSGRERHLALRKLYRRFSYFPALDLVFSLNLLVQLPLFISIYRVLTDADFFKYIGLGYLKDFQAPDRLLGYLPLLPFLMVGLSVVNIFFDSNLTQKEKTLNFILASILGIVFLNFPSNLIIFWCFCQVNTLFINVGRRLFHAPKKIRQQVQSPLFWPLLLLVGVLIFLYNPSQIYLSSPSDFGESWSGVFLSKLLPRFFLFIYFIWLLRSLIPVARWISILISILALSLIIFSFLSFPDYGLLNGSTLTRYGEVSWREKLFVDLGVFSLAAGLLFWGVKLARFKALGNSLFVFLLLGLLFQVGMPFFTEPPATEQVFAREFRKSLSFSKGKKNTIVFILDAFTGSHLRRIFDARPSLLNKFDGFVWFNQTASTGNGTFLSWPSLFSGHRALPHLLNLDRAKSNIDKTVSSVSELVLKLLKREARVSLIGTPFFITDHRTKLEEQIACERGGSSESERMCSIITGTAKNWFKKGREPSSSFFLSFSVFKVFPNVLRGLIYNGSKWLGEAQPNDWLKKKQDIFFLEHLPFWSKADGSTSTFTFIYNVITHEPYPIIPKTFHTTFQGHLGFEEIALSLVGNFLDWLKERDLFSNSKIIIVSDHGDFDSLLPVPDQGQRIDSLLMMKDFGASGLLQERAQLMSIADLPYLICNHLENQDCESEKSRIAELKNIFDEKTTLERTVFVSRGDWSPRRHPKNQFEIKTFKITDSLTSPWSPYSNHK